MDKKVEILLNSEKNIQSVNVDTYEKVSVENKRSNILEYQVRNVMSATETFQVERRENAVYRIYGKIEYMSLLNGIKGDYTLFEDFFNPQYSGFSKTLANSFDFYLVRPSDNSSGNVVGNDTEYVRYFKVMATPNEFELYPAGFSNNVYGEQAHAFSFTVDFDVSNLYDDFGFPLTELFLYAQYNPRTSPPPETLYRTRWTAYGVQSVTTFTPKDLNIGDTVETSTGVNIGDLIDYVDTQYSQTLNTPQTFYIRTTYDDGGSPPLPYIQWKYNPFIPFRLQYLGSDVYQAQLSEVVGYTGTTLSVIPVSSPSDSLYSQKYLSQYIDETKRTITNWSGGTTSTSYNWSSGVLTFNFPPPRTYNIKFEAQIILTDGTNKYLVKTVIQEDAGSGWTDIPETDKLYQISNQRTIVEINKTYEYGDQIRMMVQLVPNTVPEDPANIIPTYATILRNDGIFVWRYISEQGYLDPLTGDGVDYPFINKKRYLFQNIVLGLVPDLTDTPTRTAFEEVWYTDDAESLDITPTNDLDDIGKPCQ